MSRNISNIQQRSWLLFCLGLLWLVAACRTDPISCDDSLGCAIIRPGSPVQLATLLPTSGETAVWGQELSRGINLAISDWNGELLDHDIELIPLDSACDPTLGQTAVQTLAEEGVLLGIIGPACSDVAQAILPLVRRSNWLVISPASTDPALTQDQPDQAFFRTIPNHRQQAIGAAYFAYEQLGMRQTAVFQDNTEFNTLLAQQFSNTFTQLGGSVTYFGNLNIGQSEVTDILTEAASTSPELIYLALFEPEASLIVTRLAEINPLNRAVLLGSDSLFTPHFASQIGNTAADLYVTNPVLDRVAYAGFLETWAARYEVPPTSSAPAYAYDATQLLLTAIEEVAIVGQNGALVIGRGAVRERLAATQNVAGLTGSLSCTSHGECAAAGYGVYELDTAVRNNALWPPPLVWQFGQPTEQGDFR